MIDSNHREIDLLEETKSIANENYRKFDVFDDDTLKEKIIQEYGYFYQEQYEFSKRLKMIIINGNYTQVEFATYVGIKAPTISNYVNGKRIADNKELQKMARKLCVSTDYLLGRTDCITFSAQEINKIIGLSENAMKILSMLNHNVEEIQDLMDPMEVSKVHKNKLDIFSSFVADLPNFSMFLTLIEGYVRTKQEINNLSNDKENILNYDTEKENLETRLIGIEGRIQKSILESLNKIIEKGDKNNVKK